MRGSMTTSSVKAASTALKARLETMLGGKVVHLSIKQVDLVNDSTLVEVRFVVPTARTVRVSTASSPRIERITLP